MEDELYHHTITGEPVVAFRWDGIADTDTEPVARFLARHLSDPGQYTLTVSADPGYRSGHQAITGSRLTILTNGRTIPVPAGSWIVITGIDKPRHTRTVLMQSPLLFTDAYRKGRPDA